MLSDVIEASSGDLELAARARVVRSRVHQARGEVEAATADLTTALEEAVTQGATGVQMRIQLLLAQQPGESAGQRLAAAEALATEADVTPRLERLFRAVRAAVLAEGEDEGEDGA